LPYASFWERISVVDIANLRDAVYGAGLEATQTSRGQPPLEAIRRARNGRKRANPRSGLSRTGFIFIGETETTAEVTRLSAVTVGSRDPRNGAAAH